MHFHNTYYEEGLEEQAAELAQLILYMQNRKKKCIKVPNIRKWENCIEKTIDVLEEVIGVKVYKTKTSDGYQLYVKNALQIQHDTSDENYCYSDEVPFYSECMILKELLEYFLNLHERWLAFTKEMDESGSDIITYEWGPRAKAFIDPMVH
uniref:Uncharacterized protein n=1 Tax=Setaria digitata TaxID=48799 RepID=A0A915Q7F7_9BILA